MLMEQKGAVWGSYLHVQTKRLFVIRDGRMLLSYTNLNTNIETGGSKNTLRAAEHNANLHLTVL